MGQIGKIVSNQNVSQTCLHLSVALSIAYIYVAHVMVISAKQGLVCSFPHLRTPVGKRIRNSGLNLAAISALVEKILERQNNFVLKTVN